MKRHAIVAALILVGSAAFAAQPRVVEPSAALVQCYRLGLAAYTPDAAVIRFAAQIRSRRLSVPQMAEAAQTARRAERSGYGAAAAILADMGAPPAVAEPYASAAVALGRPLALTAAARREVPGDVSGERIWSVLDEAQRLAPAQTGAMPAWLKLSRGADALWAFHLGNLAAALQSGMAEGSEQTPLVGNAGALAATAPKGTPTDLVDNLRAVAAADRRGRVTEAALRSLDDAILDQFGPYEPR